MFIIKFIIYISIICISSYIGVLYSKKYSNRVKELKELKNSLNILKTKIKFTYEPIPEIFADIAKNSNFQISKIFENAKNYMSTIRCWRSMG